MLHAIILAALLGPQAVITNSGSTNFAGYTVTLKRDGAARIDNAGTTTTQHVDAKLVTQLYADLAASGPLDQLTAGHCMKSASFGTSTHLAYAGTTSPDLQCAGDAHTRVLAADVNAILAALNMKATPRHAMMRVPQRLVEPQVTPTAPPASPQ